MLKLFKWIAIAIVSFVLLIVGAVAVVIGLMYYNFATAKERMAAVTVPDTDAVLQVYSKRSHPMLPEYHRRMVVRQPGLPDQDVEIWPDPVGHNILEVHALRETSGVAVSVSDPEWAAKSQSTGVLFDQVLPFSTTASSAPLTTQTYIGHFETKMMKWVPAP